MNKNIGLELVVYSLLLAGLSYLVNELAPELASVTFTVGLVGGGLCLLWGVGAVLGKNGKAPPVLTLIPTSFVMFSQVIRAAGGGAPNVEPDQRAAAVIALLCILSIAMLVRVAYAGLGSDEQPASPTQDAEVVSKTTGKRADQTDASNRE